MTNQILTSITKGQQFSHVPLVQMAYVSLIHHSVLVRTERQLPSNLALSAKPVLSLLGENSLEYRLRKLSTSSRLLRNKDFFCSCVKITPITNLREAVTIGGMGVSLTTEILATWGTYLS